MLLKACVNGPRRPGEHPALPVTASDLATEVRLVVAAGADAVHLHVKDDDGADTLDGPRLAGVLAAVRPVSPGTPVGVTTGAWAMPDPDRRVSAVRGWTVLPDFAGVNWHEPGAEQVAATLLNLGIGVEAGLWHAAAVEAWLSSPLSRSCFRILIELPDGLDATATETEADQLLALIPDDRRASATVLLHGQGDSAWPALRHAGRRGLATRIGLEDVLELPDGRVTPDNASLIRAARSMMSASPPVAG